MTDSIRLCAAMVLLMAGGFRCSCGNLDQDAAGSDTADMDTIDDVPDVHPEDTDITKDDPLADYGPQTSCYEELGQRLIVEGDLALIRLPDSDSLKLVDWARAAVVGELATTGCVQGMALSANGQVAFVEEMQEGGLFLVMAALVENRLQEVARVNLGESLRVRVGWLWISEGRVPGGLERHEQQVDPEYGDIVFSYVDPCYRLLNAPWGEANPDSAFIDGDDVRVCLIDAKQVGEVSTWSLADGDGRAKEAAWVGESIVIRLVLLETAANADRFPNAEGNYGRRLALVDAAVLAGEKRASLANTDRRGAIESRGNVILAAGEYGTEGNLGWEQENVLSLLMANADGLLIEGVEPEASGECVDINGRHIRVLDDAGLFWAGPGGMVVFDLTDVTAPLETCIPF